MAERVTDERAAERAAAAAPKRPERRLFLSGFALRDLLDPRLRGSVGRL